MRDLAAQIPTEPNFETDEDQLVDFFGHGVHNVKFMGVCPISGIRMYDMPGCPYPDHDFVALEAAEYDLEGPDFIYAWLASNDGEQSRKALEMAKAMWRGEAIKPAFSSLAQDVISRCVITESSVTLPDGQLDRKVYEEVKKYMEAAGGRWTTKAKAFLFKRDPRQQLAAALATGKLVSTKKETQAFYTPSTIVERVMAHLPDADLTGKLMLEPSAGEGAIADALQAAGAEVECVEIDPQSIDILSRKGYYILGDDFLSLITLPRHYDAIVMNPPFSKGQDVQHVTHALKFLKPGGTLLAIMSPSFTSNTSKLHQAFRELVAQRGRIVEEFEPGAFKESGTNVRTVLVKLAA